MNDYKLLIRGVCILLMTALATFPGVFAQREQTASALKTLPVEGKSKVYAIQIAASKVYLEPEDFNRTLGIRDPVRFFKKDGWFKYVIGRFSSNREATNYLAGLSVPAFVTYYYESLLTDQDSLNSSLTGPSVDTAAVIVADGVVTNQDTLQDSLTVLQVQDSLRKILYRTKIHEADSVFNQVRDLVLARTLYHEAVLLDPEKNYPKDQIVEIDRQIKSQPRNLLRQVPKVIYAIVALIGLMIMVLALVLGLRTHRQRLEKKKQIIRGNYQDVITGYLFTEGEGDTMVIPKPETQLQKQLMIDEIMQLYANLAGEISEKLRKLYLETGLDNESVRKARSPHWHVRAKGFRELARMDIPAANGIVEECLNSPNEILRMEAQLAMIRLNSDDPFWFLDVQVQPFTAWEQLHVYEMIQRYQITPPDFSRWLDSPNETVIVFAIRMIRAFRQESSFDKLKSLLDHPCYEVREETFITLGELGNPEGLELLRNRYQSESEPGRLEILKAIGKIPDDANIEFLKGVREESLDLRLQAADALARIESYGIKGIETMLHGPDEDMQAIARHILDNKIRR